MLKAEKERPYVCGGVTYAGQLWFSHDDPEAKGRIDLFQPGTNEILAQVWYDKASSSRQLRMSGEVPVRVLAWLIRWSRALKPEPSFTEPCIVCGHKPMAAGGQNSVVLSEEP